MEDLIGDGFVPHTPRLPQEIWWLSFQAVEGTILAAHPGSKWINILRKVKESLSQPPLSPNSCRLHNASPIRRCCWSEISNQPKDKAQGKEGRPAHRKEKCPPHCLRHGSQLHWGVKTACVLMGGAAAGPTLGYMVTSSHGARSIDTAPPDFRELGYHPSSDVEGCQYDVDFEGMDQDFNGFDFGGFAF
ncbi:uncharacterized protein LOC142250405 isoform X2 [Anomaloglossus baeobatrachus]|uniref:uncharacterized protein LOC142250405 isoform X2 n=1 Tax=Anomaloglossus baeobatrachus TaxID=238106 RepID=UPI003F4FD149